MVSSPDSVPESKSSPPSLLLLLFSLSDVQLAVSQSITGVTLTGAAASIAFDTGKLSSGDRLAVAPPSNALLTEAITSTGLDLCSLAATDDTALQLEGIAKNVVGDGNDGASLVWGAWHVAGGPEEEEEAEEEEEDEEEDEDDR